MLQMTEPRSDAALHGLPEITGLTADSRAVEPGFLFAALPGSQADGRDFIGAAIAKGAIAILAPAGTVLPDYAGAATLITDDRPRRRFALIAAAFHGSQPATIAAITGTNGKTSTAHFTRQIWERLGHRAASLGTLGITAPGLENYGALTTPDPAALHASLADLAAAGVTHLAMEASSHGLDQYRLDGVRVTAAGFTNLSRDHLDYHGTMEAYLAAKGRLFDEVLAPGGTAVLNADAPESSALAARARAAGRRVSTYGVAGEAIRLDDAVPQADGLALGLTIEGRRYSANLPLVGTFQVANALCALGLVLADDVAPAAAVEALGHLQGVRGRLEQVARHPNGAPVYVDYAHTPDALETVLKALRPHTVGRLVCVFGCGGDRDPGKRPLMGATVAQLADRPIVTDDNPRTEDPAAIRAATLAACPGAREIGDRAGAIRSAIAGLAPDDVLIIAGKGHETGQIVGEEVHPFDDAEHARAAAAGLGAAAAAGDSR
ncbi:MAG: UDP-N-acetylmuramoyl-L-alanyl-D-glutamate--2,6-diaminopimelate ligase [Inquilinus sp.]|nr:UDP-N-acetylmuramoyl-L-alanyl-D-glutamate--2,6-diaminopimelate ligase [Inquilinus sp.]